MTAPILELADLVAADLNDANLGFTAVRDYLPVIDRRVIGDLQVFVVAKSEESSPHARGGISLADRKIYVCVLKKLSQGSNNSFDRGEIDAIFNTTIEPIKSRLSFGSLGNYSWIKTDHETLFDAGHLEKDRQLTSVMTVTYRSLDTNAG